MPNNLLSSAHLKLKPSSIWKLYIYDAAYKYFDNNKVIIPPHDIKPVSMAAKFIDRGPQ
jgi:hypothetical protein